MNNLVTRELEEGDYHKGFLELLSALTSVGDISEKAFKGFLTATWIFVRSRACHSSYFFVCSLLYPLCILAKSGNKIRFSLMTARFNELKLRAPDSRITVIEGDLLRCGLQQHWH